MEFWHNLVVQEINLIIKEVAEKRTNPVPSFTVVSFAIPFNIKFMIAFISIQLRPRSGRRQ
jgi:hypothetical protein